jgi:hypothetical protein
VFGRRLICSKIGLVEYGLGISNFSLEIYIFFLLKHQVFLRCEPERVLCEELLHFLGFRI